MDAAYLIKQEAYRLGFSYVGISKAAFLEDEAPRLDDWLQRHYNGQMSYMANHFDKRLDPRLLVEGAKSVVSLLYNYYTPHTQTDPSAPKISRYAYGVDYHFVVKNKLKELLHFIQTNIGEVGGRCFVEFRDELFLASELGFKVLITCDALRNADKNAVSHFSG